MALKIEMHFVAQVSQLPTNSDLGTLPLDIELHAICYMGACPPRSFSLERLGCILFVTWVSPSPTSWKLSCSISIHLICCIFFDAHPVREGLVFTFCLKICQISRMKWIWPRTQPKFRDILRHPFGSKASNDNPFQKTRGVCMETFHLNQMSIYTQEPKTYCHQNHAKLYL
jgi:hypothetical protein